MSSSINEKISAWRRKPEEVCDLDDFIDELIACLEAEKANLTRITRNDYDPQGPPSDFFGDHPMEESSTSSASRFLAAQLDAAAAANPHFDLSALLAAITKWVLAKADPRRLIDTPEERAAITSEATAAFERLVGPILIAKFGDAVGGAMVGAIKPQLGKLLDVLFLALTATLPPAPR